MRRWLLVGLGVLAVAVGLAARQLTAWSPPSQAAARPYTGVMDRYLASQWGSGIMFGNAGRWFCATKFLGSSAPGNRVSAYAWALCEETKMAGDQVVFGSGVSAPVVVYLRHSDTGFKAVGRNEPGDGDEYASDVRRLFPGDVADWIIGSGSDGVFKLLRADIVRQARAASS